MTSLHDASIIIDGLNISKFERSVFEDMRKGGVTAVNCTVSVWEDFQKTIDNIAEMKQQIREYSEILTLVRTTDDILRAKKENKTGIILGFQNAYAFEDTVRAAPFLHERSCRRGRDTRQRSLRVDSLRGRLRAGEGHDCCVFHVD